jgi:uncharacterized protein YqgV (UPF0045/DUF77 family)
MNYEQINRRYEVLFFKPVSKSIQKRIDEVISIINDNGIQAGIAFLNTTLTNKELSAEIKRLYETVGLRHANETTKDLKKQERKGFGFNAEWVQFIINYLQKHFIEKITFAVNTTLRNFLLDVLNKSIAEGMGIDETVRLLEGSGFSDMQAARIVRTEVNRAANAGTLAAGDTYDYQMQKTWIAVHDNRTRGVDPKDHASHIGLDKTTIDFEDVFVDPRNGDTLTAPGDPSASAESTINCRCKMGLKPKRDQNGRLIPKRRSTVVIYPSRRPRQQVVTI